MKSIWHTGLTNPNSTGANFLSQPERGEGKSVPSRSHSHKFGSASSPQPSPPLGEEREQRQDSRRLFRYASALSQHSILLGLLLLGGGPLVAAEAEFTLQPESVIQLEGWRTIHSWSAQTREVSGQWRTTTNWLNLATNSVPATVESRLTISIPASSLTGKQGDSLDGRLIRHYIKSEEHPTIRFALERLTLTNALPQPTPTWDFAAQGRLTLAGVTNSLTFPARLTQPEPTQLRVIGTTELNLKDFGIEPPLVQPADKSAPSIRIFNDEVTLTFELVFKPVTTSKR
jgi:polyisoprenoid-binding protein YceI